MKEFCSPINFGTQPSYPVKQRKKIFQHLDVVHNNVNFKTKIL